LTAEEIRKEAEVIITSVLLEQNAPKHRVLPTELAGIVLITREIPEVIAEIIHITIPEEKLLKNHIKEVTKPVVKGNPLLIAHVIEVQNLHVQAVPIHPGTLQKAIQAITPAVVVTPAVAVVPEAMEEAVLFPEALALLPAHEAEDKIKC